MSVWDFIREAYVGAGAMLAQWWPLLATFAIILVVFGWLWTEARNAPYDDEQPHLHPSLFPAWYDVRDEAEMIVENVQSAYVEQDERFDNPA